VSFCGGELLHSGDPVVAGIRYIIVAFCYVDLVRGLTNARSDHSDVHESTIRCNQEKRLTDLFCNSQKSTGKLSATSGSGSTSNEGFSFGFQFE